MDEGAAGAISVRTNSSRTSHASGFVTIGAGTRTDGGRTAGAAGEFDFLPAVELVGGRDRSEIPSFIGEVPAGGFPEIVAAAADADYVSEPGALAEALGGMYALGNGDTGKPPPTPAGYGKYALLAAADTEGVVAAAAVDALDEADIALDLLVEDGSWPYGVRTDNDAARRYVDRILRDGSDGDDGPCRSAVIDQGDLIRADTYARRYESPDVSVMEDALTAADDLLGYVDSKMGERDLLLVVSPTSPWWDPDVHLGVAIAKGPGFPAGDTLQSAATRQRRLVTLVDVAPTVLDFLGVERPASMLGRPFVPVDADGDLLDELVFLDRESVFAHATQVGISTSFVIFQIVVYSLAMLLLVRRERIALRERRETMVAWLRRAGLGIVAFPFSTYLATPLPAHEMGTLFYLSTLIVIDIAVVTLVSLLLRDPLERLLAVTGSTILLFIIDLSFLQMLQLNAVWGNDPIVAGRFTGLGNIAFAILGSSSLVTGALLVHRYPDRRWVFAVVAALFAVTVVVDGAPALGSDVGGVLALVPALGVTYVLLLGKRPTLRTFLLAVLAAVGALGLFLLLDFARPPESRTHLARLVEDITNRGWDAFGEALGRKVSTNLRVFRSTIWTYLVPPAVAVIGWLLFRPSGRWHQLAVRYPKLRAGLIGGLMLGIGGFAVNDSGIVVPAMVLSFLAPLSLLLHLAMERDRMREEEPA
jgi:hypothetical protein